ncbi:MAG: DNA methyltransferase [Candidatus Nanoarchaeia archaeon]|nr:DNA methyltransferase [Candidatus Nanoarchaeia archaeon]MDD5357806.1 DNA methyltransferase [Candidatus Nanoarchaeia archaeon]MDD5588725.1 DNA methyltransferase [Candidatus Nanoarchaeia archaeon]
MKKYLFIVGRNIELSVAEIKSFFERERIGFRISAKIKNGVLIETEKVLPRGIIEQLGGTVSIGEVLTEGNFEKISRDLDREMLYSVTGNKLNYVVFNFGGKDFEEIESYLKIRFREERLKATEKKLTGRIELQSGKRVSKVSSNLIDEQYFVFENCFGRIIENYDFASAEKRDMGKPVRRSELSISPRLAKILINLSQVKKGETLLDPFCGIGTILQEALLQNIKVIGVDEDKTAVNNAKTNLKWFKFNESNYKLINDNSASVKIPNADGIATEPDLGELQKKIPTTEKAKELVRKYENLMIRVLKNLKKNVRGKIVFTAPLVETMKGKISPDFHRIANATGLKIVLGPIQEFREKSIVGRNILVVE